MSFVEVQPITFNPTMRKGSDQTIRSTAVVKDADGAPIDLTTWDSITAKLRPLTASPASTDVSLGTASMDANGKLALHCTASDLSGLMAGTCAIAFAAKKTSGDGAELVGSGTFTLNG